MRTIRRFKDNRNKSVRGVRVRVRTFTGSGHRRPFITTGVPVVRKTVVESQNRFFTTARVRTYGDFKLNRSVRQTAGAKPDLDLYVFFFFFFANIFIYFLRSVRTKSFTTSAIDEKRWTWLENLFSNRIPRRALQRPVDQ